MPFFPDSIYGLIYLGALIFFGIVTLLGPNKQARRILFVLTIHWVFIRAIDWYDHENFVLWLVHDYVFFALLLFCGGGLAARASAGLFLLMVAFDSYSLIIGGTFEGASAVAEIIGITCMAIMAGSAHSGTDGKLATYSRALRSRTDSVLFLRKSWWPAWGRSRSDSGFVP